MKLLNYQYMEGESNEKTKRTFSNFRSNDYILWTQGQRIGDCNFRVLHRTWVIK
ncbi:hypothetical protein MKY89_26095 [Bacillus sp. FSL W7-1294]|uniref:hypothetical protein n=1 Tax=Bacillus TaxID=1386 RepID=UPI0012B68735|nr:hypothetical protein [Bacillus cereus]